MKLVAICSSLLLIWLLAFKVPCIGADLKCYLCWSNKSWEDCEKTEYLRDCVTDHDEVCIRQHQVTNDDSSDEGYKEVYMKMCGQARLCSVKDCEKSSTTCQIDCCHSDSCNTATKRAANVKSTLLGSVLVILMFLLQFNCVL
ncbi:uncharacterized protein LOC111337169 [Stylophora pistillata]|uniref:UPAR/Ly6 domain-containing protein n=1 Tax=Stylophora pistillata TaxID=50429 RepID=A0A2B4RTQ6_STYPI|nr:uncharacterized protein LOC111337169 [Stylophora pistillata]PFX20199.1 hypothetical protein AWC38_SpisGene15342 [Stylophora pistillata]